MRTLIVGAGALGGFYGGLLARSGEEVTFLARGETLARLREHGLSVDSKQFGSFKLPVSTAESANEVSAPDLIFFSVKAYDLDEAARHELANEHDAALLALANVEAQVDLGKVGVARPAHAEDARLFEVERDEAHERLAIAQVEREAGRQMRHEQARLDGVRHETDVSPSGAQEG